MNEAHFKEIEKVLLCISDARERAARAAKAITADGAEDHLIGSLAKAEEELSALHRKLMQETYFAVPGQPNDQEKLAV